MNFLVKCVSGFNQGVVDSEDIPLNLSRELLQDSNLIRFETKHFA